MRRRECLSLVAAAFSAGIAGCETTVEHPTATLAMRDYAEVTALPRIMRSVGGEDRMTEQRRKFTDVLDGGANLTGTQPPFPDDQHLYFNDTVYQLSRDVAEQTPATGYAVRIEMVEGTVRDGESIPFPELPEVDRQTLADLRLADGDLIGVGTSVLYTDAQSNRSALVPEPTTPIIVWENGSRARWVVQHAYDQPVYTYAYTAEVISSAADYRARLLDEFAFELAGLSGAQGDMVETAISEAEYRIASEETPSPAFVSLVEHFRTQEQVRPLDDTPTGRIGGHYLVWYGGSSYWSSLFIDDEDAFRDGSEANRSKATTT